MKISVRQLKSIIKNVIAEAEQGEDLIGKDITLMAKKIRKGSLVNFYPVPNRPDLAIPCYVLKVARPTYPGIPHRVELTMENVNTLISAWDWQVKPRS
jgi:hypothetical protein